jgi:hypothetical protein
MYEKWYRKLKLISCQNTYLSANDDIQVANDQATDEFYRGGVAAPLLSPPCSWFWMAVLAS